VVLRCALRKHRSRSDRHVKLLIPVNGPSDVTDTQFELQPRLYLCTTLILRVFHLFVHSLQLPSMTTRT
jgi:hypothetical protein